jgi:hypothetical protein
MTTPAIPTPPDSIFYVERPSVPSGMTIGEYRRSRPRRVSRWERMRRLAGGTS